MCHSFMCLFGALEEKKRYREAEGVVNLTLNHLIARDLSGGGLENWPCVIEEPHVYI